MVFKTHDPITMNDQVHNPLRKALMGLEYLLLRRGPLTMGASQVCVFARSTPEAATPDIQFHLQPLSADKPGEGLHRYSAFTSSTCQLRPESRGVIELRSPFAQDYPAIHPNYLATVKAQQVRSEEHTSELQSLMRISYAVFCLKKKTTKKPRERRTKFMAEHTVAPSIALDTLVCANQGVAKKSLLTPRDHNHNNLQSTQ